MVRAAAGGPGEAERRRRARREADRQLGREAAFLARAIDLAMEDAPATSRLAELLALVARTTGAARAAALVPVGRARTAYVTGLAADDDHEQAMELGAWLIEAAPAGARARATRSEAGGEETGIGRPDRGALRIAVVASGRTPTSTMPRRTHRKLLALPGRHRAAIGLAFRSARAADQLDRRFPPALAGHTAVALASLIAQVASEQTLADLQQAEAERQKFVRTVAHELRTPLSSLSGYLDLAMQPGRDAAETREFLERGADLVDATSTLVADLLELSRLGAGQLALEIGRFSVSEVARAAIRDVEPLAMGRSITLDAALPARLRTIEADRRRVQQILVNLLANAIKFSPQGTTVDLDVAFDGPAAVFAVRDRGAGVAASERAAIFEPFHRATGTERVVGTGLGLPIARELAQRMGGDVGVASSPGRGSVFAVALPAQPDAPPRAVAAVLARRLAAAGRTLGSGLAAGGATAAGRAGAGDGTAAGEGAAVPDRGPSGHGEPGDIHMDAAEAPGQPEAYPQSAHGRAVGG